MRKVKQSFRLYQSCCWFIVLKILFDIQYTESHGRLIEPPSRASAWRYGFNTLPNYNDHELYCGGFTRQWKKNGGKCGVCGDAWDLPQPRPHENGGQWGAGVIVRKYKPESVITIRIELTASHMGYFEFRLCSIPNGDQDCFDKNLLQILGGSPSNPSPNDLTTRFYPRNGSRIYDIKAQLPDIECEQCVLQWRYIAGNNWGMCPDGNGAVGCGPQEEFRSCSDIALGDGELTPIHPVFPSLRPKVPPSKPESPKPSSDTSDYSLIYITIAILAIGASLGLVLYLYTRNRRFNRLLHVDWNWFCPKKASKSAATFISSLSTSKPQVIDITPTKQSKEIVQNAPPSLIPPIPPPRTKRQNQLKEDMEKS